MSIDSFNSLIIIVINGSLLLLSFLSFINPLKANKKANIWLGVSFLMWSTFWMEEIMLLVQVDNINSYFLFILRFLQFLTPMFFYLSVVYFTNPNFKFKAKELKHIFLPLLYVIILFIQFLNLNENLNFIQISLVGLILFQSMFYVGIAYFKIRKHKKQVLLFSSDTLGINLNWLEYIIGLMFLVTLIVFVYNIFLDFATPNVFANTIFLMVIYAIAYCSLKQKEIYPLDKKQRSQLISINEEEITDTKRKIVSDENLAIIKNQLNILMIEEKPYLDSELNLIKLASLVEVTPHQLSYVINTGFQKNFFEFVNSYRVEKAKELLINNEKDHLSILGIAFESGFNSKTSFNTIFKKVESQTPSEFKKTGSNL